MKPKSTLRNFIALAGSSILALCFASADTYTWTQTSVTGSQDWTTAGNWDVSGVYATGTANELRFFADITTIHPTFGTQTIVSVPTTLSMGILTLQGKGPNNTSGFTTIIGDSSSTWTIGDGATGTVNLNATRHTSLDRYFRYNIAANITLNQALTTFTGGGNAGDDARGGFEFSGNITGAAGYGITKSGISVLILSGSNTYTGTTLVSGGVLRLGSANALSGGIGVAGGTSALTINGGVVELASGNFQRNLGVGSSQFQITGGVSGFSAVGDHRVVTVNNDASQELQWGSTSFQPGTLVLNAIQANNSLELTNKIDLNNATRTVQVNANKALLSGVIRTASGTAGLTKDGTGTLVLTGANSYNGNTTITAGVLSVGASNNLGASGAGLVFNGGTLQITGTSLSNMTGLGHAVTFTAAKAVAFDIQDATNTFTVDQILNQTTGTLTKSGAGALVLNQANTFTGATTVNGGGTLVLDYGSGQDNSKISTTAALSINGGTLILRGGTFSQAVLSTTIGLPTNSGLPPTGNSISREGVGATSVINLGAITLNPLSTLAISEGGIAQTSSTTTNGILGIGKVTVGSNFADKSGSDIVAYTGYTAPTSFTSGGSGGSATAVNQWTGGGSLGGSLNSYALRISNSGDSDVLNIGANNLTVGVDNGTFLYAGGTGTDNNFTINGTGAVRTATTNRSMHVNTYIGTLTVNAIMVHGSGGLTKSGVGTLVAGGNNNYTGATYIQQGVLRIANTTGLGAVSTGTLGTFVQAGAALELSQTTGGSPTNITVGAEALALNGTGISDAGALRNHSGSNTYGGLITIGASGARINANAATSLALTGGIVTTLTQDVTFGGAGNTTVSTTAISGSGRVIKDGLGTLTLSAVNTYTGATLVSAGTLFVSGSLVSDVTVSDTATIAGGGTVDDLILGGGSFFDLFLAVNSADSLAATNISFAAAGFGIDNLLANGLAVNWGTISNGTYTLITGTLNSTNLGNFGSANAYNIGGGRTAYFQEGSLQLVVIPEPRAALLGCLGVLLLLRRRR